MKKTICESLALGALSLLVTFAVIFLSSCGGGDGGETTEAPEQLTCVKDGVEYIINPDGTYTPWRDVVVEQEFVDEEGRVVEYLVRDVVLDGVTVIADCGSNVTINITANESTATSDTDIGSNNDNNSGGE